MRINALITAAILLGAITMTPGCNHGNGGNGGSISNPPGNGGTTTAPPPPVVLPDLDYEQIARDAGILAAAAYVGFNGTTGPQASAIKQVCALIKQNLSAFQAGGFASSQGQLNALIDQSFSGSQLAYASVAKLFSGIMLGELDSLFAAHPEWAGDSTKVAGIVGAFCDGASATLTSYGVKGVLPKTVLGRQIVRTNCDKGQCTIQVVPAKK